MARTYQTVVNGANVMVHLPSWHSKDGAGLRGIIACHGHGGSSVQIAQGEAFAGHPEFIADQGYLVACISTTDLWLNPTAMGRITDLYNFMLAQGIDGPKVGLLAWSMGGGHALRWLIENPTKIAAGFLCSPLTDLQWAYDTNVTWAAELDAAYNTFASANAAARSPINNVATFRGGPKILIAHATNDATLPYTQTTTFVNTVNDPSIILRQPDILGNHQGGLTQIKPSESWEFIRTNWS